MSNRWTLAASVLFCAGSQPALAEQAGPVPDEVVEICMAQNDASKLPDCLKEGAFGLYMLQLAGSPDYFGPTAAPVIQSCRQSNDTIEGAWTCFDEAAKDAAETRDLVGLDKIADGCVAAISDPEVAQRLARAASERRQVRFPDEMFSGGNIYHPFKGCAS